MGRSDLLGLYLLLMDLQTFDRKASRMILTSMQVLMDPFESSGWSRTGEYDSKSVLLETCLGDSTVSTVAAAVLARNIRASLLSPIVQDVPLLDSTSPPILPTNQAIMLQGIYPGDAADVTQAYTSTPPGTNVHRCYPYRGDIHYESVIFLDTGNLGEACQNIHGITIPCVFENHAHC
jgi:hypothetical protein